MGLMEGDTQNSMLYWYPKLKKLDINLPRTVLVECEMFPEQNVMIGYDKEEVEEAVEAVGGYPVFIRTDKASAKHHMEKVSKVYNVEELHGKIHRLADENLSLGWYGVSYKAIAVREWLDIKHDFTAFWGDMPVGYEIRAFIRDGVIECKHFYWIKDAIERPSIEDWEEIWEAGREYTMNKWGEVEPVIEKIAKEFKGWWSVDVALTEEDEWVVIDMALGEDSFHPPKCKYAPDSIKEIYGGEEIEQE